MADPLHARDLIVEDALQSRGLVVDDEALIEQERELDEDLKRASGSNDTLSRTNSRSSSKGKGRDDSPDDGGDGAYTFDGDSAYRREASSSSSTLRPQQRPQNGYDTVKDENDGPMPASYPYKVRKAPPGHRQPHPAGTPISTTAFHHPQQQSVYASISPNCAYQSTSNLNHNPHNEEDDPASPFRRPGQGYHRTSDRLIGSILARDPLKELQHADSEHSKSLTKKQVRAAWWRSIFINCLFVLAWYLCSTLISLYNKWMFSPDHYNFGYPLFVTSCHMLVQFSLCSLVLSIFPTLRPRSKPKTRDYGTKVMPCGLATGLDIGLSNLSLKTITLSFYTMCKSSVLGFVLIWAFIFRLERPTLPLIGIISIITAGVIMMVSSETQFHLVGMLQVLTASCLSGLRWSLTQILLDKESMGMNNPFATLFWLAPIMGISLAVCSIFIEGWFTVFSSEFFDGFDRIIVTAGVIVLPGVIAFSMNVAEFGLIQRTSVVTLSVAGMFKEVITIFLSTVVFHDELTPINISGLCVAIIGIGMYNYLKYRNYKILEKKLLENGTAMDERGVNGNIDVVNDDEAEMEALHSSTRSRMRDHDGNQFQLVGEDDFDSSSESGDEEPLGSQHKNKHIPYDAGDADDGIDRLPAYAEANPNAKNETRQMEEKVNRDPMLLDLDREEQQLEIEMDKTRHVSRKETTDQLLFDADEGGGSRSH